MSYLETAEDEPDLDYGELGLETEQDVEVVARFERTIQLPPGAGRVDWSRIHQGLVAHSLAKGRAADGSVLPRERVEDQEDEVTILARQEVPLEALPARTRALSLARRLVASGWEVHVGWSATHVAAVLYQSDADEDAPEPYRRGDVRYPAEDREHFRVIARRGPLACRVYFQKRPEKSMELRWGQFQDPVSGRIYFAPAKPDARKRWAERGLVPIPEPYEFDDWLDIVAPAATPKPKKKRGDEALLDGQEWKA